MDDIDSKLDAVKKLIDAVPDAIIDEFQSRVVAKTPELSGTLKKGWKREHDVIVNTVKYAAFVETGTDKMAGAHMVKATSNEIENITKVAIEEVTK